MKKGGICLMRILWVCSIVFKIKTIRDAHTATAVSLPEYSITDPIQYSYTVFNKFYPELFVSGTGSTIYHLAELAVIHVRSAPVRWRGIIAGGGGFYGFGIWLIADP